MMEHFQTEDEAKKPQAIGQVAAESVILAACHYVKWATANLKVSEIVSESTNGEHVSQAPL
jgi:hypothetical protein